MPTTSIVRLAGEPHMVLAVEGASFLDDDTDMLDFACDEGVRHVQLAHYIRNTLGDFQTCAPTSAGPTPPMPIVCLGWPTGWVRITSVSAPT